ncbi:metal-dependent hydrolase [Lacinutrix sp. C3R15]|uniref:metal-dependent hydrolase n=1 Tax=Flavobacteriaceae TaxID=49546 RepID=UPI001C07FBF8|nr:MULTISPECIES: metal-dependent hydrolase [Flavobacteriaceae]MBU2939917.1 metal-dependent hydrolase [Lacinutrix sp. C3R15]MDO6623233.1 metal-dependent hydrolase [Oceanihabitans sp. 1_MG-2023]
MASIFGHGLVAYTTAKVIDSKTSTLLLLLAIGCAILPDIDVLAFKLGVPYVHPLGHRGFTHSILFAILWSGLLAFIFGKNRKQIFFIVLFLSTISHGVLDGMTTGGKGVGFFIPFQNSRYFFPWQVIKVSPIGIKQFFSEWGMQVIISELIYIAIPCSIILITLSIAKKKKEWT